MSLWHEFMIETINEKYEKMGIDSSSDSRVMINIDQVAAFYETANNDTREMRTAIELKNGERYIVDELYDKVKELICK